MEYCFHQSVSGVVLNNPSRHKAAFMFLSFVLVWQPLGVSAANCAEASLQVENPVMADHVSVHQHYVSADRTAMQHTVDTGMTGEQLTHSTQVFEDCCGDLHCVQGSCGSATGLVDGLVVWVTAAKTWIPERTDISLYRNNELPTPFRPPVIA